MTQTPRPPRIKPPTTPRQTPNVSFGARPQSVASRSRLVGSFTIGNSDTDDNDRRVGQGLKQTGWSGFVNGVVNQAIDDGFQRFSLHNPFGCLDGEEMEATQYLQAKAAGLHWLTDGFVEAWKPITARFEVIAYQGSIELDPAFANEWKAGSVPFARFVRDCYQPIIDAGMTVGIDSHQHLLPGSSSIAAHRFLAQMGIGRMYFEPGPAFDDHHWFKAGMGIWTANDNSTIVQNRSEPWQLFPVFDDTETIIQLAQAPADIIANPKYNAPKAYADMWAGCTWDNLPDWIARWCNYHFAKGHTVAVNPRDFKRFGLKAKDVLTAEVTT